MSEPIVIIDASLLLKAILPNPEIARAQEAISKLKSAQIVVPALWVYEVTSTLAKAVHFDQITVEESKAILSHLMALDVHSIPPDEVQGSLALDWSFRLRRASAYDCFYLAMADALDAPFWTADTRLVNSFQDQRPEWLHWIGDEENP